MINKFMVIAEYNINLWKLMAFSYKKSQKYVVEERILLKTAKQQIDKMPRHTFNKQCQDLF